MVEPQPDAWSSEVTRLGFTLYNHVRPLGRSLIGCSAGVRGNGMCFSAETLRSVPWNSYSLNEDLEYGLMLLLKGITIEFAPEARVFAMMPTNARNAESQRTRWERGRFPVIKRYGPRLLAQAVRNVSFRPFDAFVELITPAFVNMFGIVCLLLGVHLLLPGIGIESVAPFRIAWLMVVLFGLVHVLVGLYAARADRLLYKAFLYIPRYAFWKFALYAKIFRRRSSGEEWVRTTRDHVVSAPDQR
jgi:cellulose synthase/poly-beta-1,6-N-acetylglucosamine synthase-like glycosyltransferase